MDICVHSHHSIANLSCDDPHFIFSIRARDDHPATIPDSHNRIGLLWMVFDDIDRVESSKDVIFTADHAQQIIDKLVDLPNESMVIFQCFAGISRSAALAGALMQFLEGTAAPIFLGSGPNGRFCPNIHVFSTMLKVLMENADRLKKFEPKIFKRLKT